MPWLRRPFLQRHPPWFYPEAKNLRGYAHSGPFGSQVDGLYPSTLVKNDLRLRSRPMVYTPSGGNIRLPMGSQTPKVYHNPPRRTIQNRGRLKFRRVAVRFYHRNQLCGIGKEVVGRCRSGAGTSRAGPRVEVRRFHFGPVPTGGIMGTSFSFKPHWDFGNVGSLTTEQRRLAHGTPVHKPPRQRQSVSSVPFTCF